MGADRRENSSLVMGTKHTAGDVHSNSEVRDSLVLRLRCVRLCAPVKHETSSRRRRGSGGRIFY